jgi:hypothetical protein
VLCGISQGSTRDVHGKEANGKKPDAMVAGSEPKTTNNVKGVRPEATRHFRTRRRKTKLMTSRHKEQNRIRDVQRKLGVCGVTVGWVTMLQARWTLIRFRGEPVWK